MANLPENPVYDAGVYQLETTDPVQGGASGVSNAPLKNLANRTSWLKQVVDSLSSLVGGLAPTNSPTFTGTPAAPTPALGDSSTKIPTTAFVQNTLSGVLNKSVAGGVNVNLTSVEAGNGILNFTGLITANIAVIVPPASKNWVVQNNTTGAFALTLKTAAGTGVAIKQGKSAELSCDGTNVFSSNTDYDNVALTGIPTTPTATSGDSSTQVASTAFVFNAIDGLQTIGVGGGVDVNLTAAQSGTGILKFTGVLTANINVVFPTNSGQWIIDNSTTGGFNLTAKHSATAGVVLPQGSAVVVYSDGTTMKFASSASQASFTATPYAPSVGSTSLVVLGGYTPGNIMVERNGVLLEPNEFTATDGTNITGLSATIAGDSFTVYAFKSFTVANAVLKSGDTMAGPLLLAANSTAPNVAAGDSSTLVANTAFVQTAITGKSGPSVRGLRAANNSTTPGTQYDIAATSVTVWNPSTGATRHFHNPASVTINTATAGPIANGRDQAAAFSNNTWLHAYIISDGTLVRGIWSASPPPAGPVLPAGYTSWAYVGAVFYGTGSLASVRILGKWANYSQPPAAVTGGTATVVTGVSIASLVPPGAEEFKIYVPNMGISSNGSGSYGLTCLIQVEASLTPWQCGIQGVAAASQPQFFSGGSAILANLSQGFNYQLQIASGSGPTVTIGIQGYSLPNGA